MSETKSEVRVGLVVSSEVLSARRVSEILGMEPSRITIKGTPTGQPGFPEHPLHIAIFSSHLGVDQRLQKHLEAVLDICDRVKVPLATLVENCRVTVHCTYLVRQDGGWTISPELCRRMAALPIEYVFAVEPGSTN